MTAQGGLAGWAERSALRRAGSLTTGGSVPGRLRFVFYGRVPAGDWQDPVTSRARQREQAGALVRGHRGDRGGTVRRRGIPDGGVGPAPAGCRAGRAQLADPGRGWDAIVTG
jgi:site-specific DNA recombinase